MTKLWINLREFFERRGIEEIHFDLCALADYYDDLMRSAIAGFRDKAVEIISATAGHDICFFTGIPVTLSIMEKLSLPQVWPDFTATYKMVIVARYRDQEYAVEKTALSCK